MFAYMYKSEDGMVFKVCQTQDEVMEKANNLACMGYKVTVFDYDAENKEFLEFYTI